jgi:DNA-binding CsgD family transcriptional regulator
MSSYRSQFLIASSLGEYAETATFHVLHFIFSRIPERSRWGISIAWGECLMPTIAKRRPQSRKITTRQAVLPRPTPFIQLLDDGGLPLTVAEWELVSTSLALSKRESEISRLLLDDASESAIAATLSISSKTVHAHIERLYRKLGVHSRHQLVTRLFKAYLSVLSENGTERIGSLALGFKA